jgi:hypothetical protein
LVTDMEIISDITFKTMAIYFIEYF